jgi:hypothetical protein
MMPPSQKEHEHTYRGFNLFLREDLHAILALVRGEGAISGITNRMLRRVLTGKSGPQVSRLLKRLRLHHRIKRVGKTYK